MRVLVVGVVALLVPGCLAGLCDNVPYDLMFLLDGSSSISKADFIRQLNFVYNMIAQLDVSSDRVRVGLAEYSGANRAETIIQLGEFGDSLDLLNAVCTSGICDYCYRCGSNNFYRNYFVGLEGILDCCSDYSAAGDACCCYEHGACPIFHLLGGTFPSYGFTAVATEFQSRGRSSTYQFLVMTTDGEFGEDASAESDALKASGVIIATIGIGQYNRTQLVATASAENFVFDVSDFSNLGDFISPIVEQLCVQTSSSASTTQTPTSSMSQTSTASVSQSSTASVSQSPSSSPTQTPTPSPSSSPSPSPSQTPTSSPSPTTTQTPTPSASPTGSPTASPTASPSPTASVSRTPTPSPTPSVTQTHTGSASPSPTVTPTVTPSPEYTNDQVQSIVVGTVAGVGAALVAAALAYFLMRTCMPGDEEDRPPEGRRFSWAKAKLIWRRSSDLKNIDIVVNPLFLKQQQTVQKRLADVEGQLALSDEPNKGAQEGGNPQPDVARLPTQLPDSE